MFVSFQGGSLMSVAPFEIMQEAGGMGKTINVSHSHTHKLMYAHTHALGLAKKLKPHTTENNSTEHITTAKHSAERL